MKTFKMRWKSVKLALLAVVLAGVFALTTVSFAAGGGMGAGPGAGAGMGAGPGAEGGMGHGMAPGSGMTGHGPGTGHQDSNMENGPQGSIGPQ